MYGVARPARARAASSATSRARSSRWWAPNPSMVNPVTMTPLSRTRFRGILGISPEAKPTVTNRPPQRRARSACSAQRPAHRVDDDVRPVAGDLLHPHLEVLGRVVDGHFRAALEAQGRLLGRGCRGHHPGPQHRAELDRGQAHAPGGPEHHGPLPRLDPGHAAQRVVRRGMGHPGRGRGAQFDRRVDGLERPAPARRSARRRRRTSSTP